MECLHGNPTVTCVKPKLPRHEHDILIEMSINQIFKIISYYDLYISWLNNNTSITKCV